MFDLIYNQFIAINIYIYIPLMISHNSSYILVKTVMKEAIPTIYINIYQWFLIYRFQKMRDWEKARKISNLNIYIYILTILFKKVVSQNVMIKSLLNPYLFYKRVAIAHICFIQCMQYILLLWRKTILLSKNSRSQWCNLVLARRANIFWIASRKVYSDGEKWARKDVTLSRGANKLQKEQRLLNATRTLYNEHCSTYSAR